jgi:hypothetical protein
MTDNDTNLRQQLQDLHSQIEKTESVDEKGQALLRDLKAEIDELLARSDDDDGLLPGTERLEEGVATFEASHPDLARTLRQVLDTLSNAGI